MMNYIELQYPQYDITGIMVCKRNHPHWKSQDSDSLARRVHPDQGNSNSYFQLGELLYIILGKFHHDLTARPKPGIMVNVRENIPK